MRFSVVMLVACGTAPAPSEPHADVSACEAPAGGTPPEFSMEGASLRVDSPESESVTMLHLTDDLNGDAQPDLTLGFQRPGMGNVDALRFFDASAVGSLTAGTGAWLTLESVLPNRRLGHALAVANQFSERGGALSIGDGDRAYYFFELPLLPDATLDDATGVLRADGAEFEAVSQGLSVANDLDGDGFGEFLIVAHRMGEPGPEGELGVILIVRSPNGGTPSADAVESKIEGVPDPYGVESLRVTRAVQTGDLNSDGYDDVVVGGLNKDHPGDQSVAWILPGPFLEARSLDDAVARIDGGQEVAHVGDPDEDDVANLVVLEDHSAYAARLLSGPFAGVISVAEGVKVAPADPALVATIMAAPGDIDGDGFTELFLEERLPTSEPEWQDSGAGVLVWGPLCAPDARVRRATALVGEEGSPRSLGYLAGGPDVDGDGLPDLAVYTGGDFRTPASYVFTAADLLGD